MNFRSCSQYIKKMIYAIQLFFFYILFYFKNVTYYFKKFVFIIILSTFQK